jgi:hypothetical protein
MRNIRRVLCRNRLKLNYSRFGTICGSSLAFRQGVADVYSGQDVVCPFSYAVENGGTYSHRITPKIGLTAEALYARQSLI